MFSSWRSMDDPPGNVDSGPPTGWVRLQLEPVDVPLEVDESLLLSTVQSAIPGAHGLYYNENGQKKALRFDAYSGRIYKGQPGWHSKPIFINLAHGCRTHAFGQYESATKTFEKSVSAIQRMLATSDLSSCWEPGATSQQRSTRSERKRGEEKEKAREKRVTRPTKSGFEAQAEEHLEEHSDGSIDSGRSNDLQKLQEENENLKQLLHDIEINSSKFERDAGEKGKALGKAQLRIDELLKEIEQMKLREYLDSSVTESERAAYSTLVSTPQKTALLDVDEFASLRRAKEEVERELAVEREKIYQLEKSKDELISKLEWSLGEHKQWLGDARSRISQLEGEISGQAAEFERTRLDLQAAIDRLHEKNCHLKHELHEVTTENERLKGELEKLKAEFSEGHPEVSAWDNERTNLKEQIEELKGQLAAKEHEASALHGTIGDLRSELGAKDAHIGTLNQQKNDIEWSLGEHRQWLSDANNRISGLEAELNALRTQGEEITMRLQHSDEAAFRPEIDNLKAQILEKENELQRLRPVEETKNNEIGALRGENDWLKGELSAKDGHINDLNKLKNDAEWSLGEHRQWLSNANNRLSELENSINEKNTLINSMQQEIQRLQKLIAEMPEQKDTAEETQQLRERIVELESKLHDVEKSLSEAPNVDELNALHAKVDGMQHEINDKNSELGNVHKLKNDAEWSLGEHRQWLADANNRINDLTNCLSDKERQIESMQKEIDELRIVKLQEGERPGQEELQQLHDRISDLEQQLSNVPKPDEINHLRAENERLVGEINDKNRIIDELNHLKNDAEWNLGEHRHWLNDAKSRISGLEAELHSKSEALNALQAQRDTSVGEDPMIARLESNVAELREELRQVTEEKIEKERENEGINKMVQGLLEDLNDKNRQLDELNKLKNDTEWKLGEHRQWLSDANNRIGELERALESKNDEADRLLGESRETIANLQQQTNDLSGQIEQLKRDKEVLEQKLETPIEKQAVQMAAAVPTEPHDGMDGDQLQAELLKKEELLDRMNREASNKDEEIKNLHHIIGDIQRQLNDKTIQLERTTHLKNDTEWSLGEHKQWLSDANNRIGQLTSEVNEKSRIIDILHHQLEELKKALDATGDAKKLMDEIKEKNRIIDDLNKLKNDTEWSLGEHKQWLNDANNRANGFENACKDKDAIIDALRKEMEELKTASSEIPHGALPSEGEDLAKLHENIQNLEEKLRDAERAIAEAPKGDEINALRDENERLVSEISDKNRIIDELNKIRDEKEWTLGEHRQWLADANNRASSLENAMKEKDAMIERLHKEINDLKKLSEEMQHMEVKLQEAEHVVAEHVKTDEISMLNNEVDRLNNELIGKNGIIDELVQQKNDAEWKLGEHRQWLSDANNRADGLENALKEKDAIIGDLHKQLDELKELPETVRHLEHRLREAEDQTVQAPKDEEINQLKEEIDRLNNELVEKNHMVDVLNGQKNDAEWKLGEHQHWLADANGKADWLKGENDRLCAEMGEKNRIIDDLNRIRDEKDWSLGEHRQWLSDANNRADGLERELKEKNDVIDALHKEIDELRTVKVETPEVEGVATLRETIVNLEGKLRDTELALSEAQKADDVNKLRAETDRLVNEINEKNRIIDELNKLKGEAEWSLGEHRQWLSDANNRANGLENTVKEKDEQIGALNKELDELRAVKVETPADALNEQIEQLQSKVQELEGRLRDSEKAIAEAPKPEENNWLRSEIERLGNEIGEKNRIIDELNNLKSAAEWSLGEHRQWLSDANNRANGLENAVREKDGIIDGLRKENDELRAVKLQIPEEALTAEQVNELRETVKNLEAKLRDAPSADEVANLRGEIDRLVSEINEKNRIIDDLNRIRDEKEWQLGEHRQWLSDANNRANGLESAVREKDELIEGLRRENEELKALRGEQEEFAVREQIPELQSSLHDLEQKLRDTEKALAEASKGDEINGLKSEVDRLVNEINEKNRIIDELNKIKDDKEWSIGEYRQWLSDAHNRANDLENALNEKDKVIEGLHKENDELKSAQSEGIKSREGVGPKSEEFDALKDEVNRLASEINEKNRIIDDLNRIRDEKEWQLGEHRQWLSDANNRANGLECAINEKDGFIEKLQRELDELRTVKVETPESTEHDEVKQLHEKMQDLEGQLRDKESALAQAPTPEEISGLRCEIDRLVGEINEKNRIIDDLNRIRDEKEWQLGEHRQWLSDANNRANNLENAIKDKNGLIGSLQKELDELRTVSVATTEGALQDEIKQLRDNVHDLEAKLHDSQRAATEAPKAEEINNLQAEVNRLANEINEKNRIIDDLNRIRDEKEWQLGEHRQWLSDANNRASGLENVLKEKDDVIDGLRKEIDDLKTVKVESPFTIAPVEEIDHLRSELDRLVNEINEKNRIIDDLNRIRDEKEWSLGEHRQWLSDANNRADGLEKAISEKDDIISGLRQENDDLRAYQLETSGSVDTVNKLREYVENLESQLRSSRTEIDRAPTCEELDGLRAEKDRLVNEISEKNRIIGDLNRIRDEKEWQLGEHRQWLSDANDRANGLENSIKEKDATIEELRKAVEDLKGVSQQIPELEDRIRLLERQPTESVDHAQPIAPSQDEINGLRAEIERLVNEINEKNRIIDDLNRIRDEKEWQLGEHRQWLSDANNRANALEGASADKDRLISELRKEIDELKSLKLEAADDGERQQLREKVQHLEGKLQETERLLAEAVKPDIISTLESTINELRNELADKNTQMEHLSKERNDAEWRLGEHKQWLADANKRNEELSNSLKEKEDAMKALRATHDELRARIDELERTLKEVEASAQSSKEARERSEQRIAELEHEISKLKDGYESALKSARTEVYELHERNIKLEETLKKTEVIVINLQKEKEATRRSLILEQPRVEFKNREELEEEIKRLREKYDELSKLLKCTDELLAKLQAEAPDTADVDTLHRKVEMLNQQLNDKNAELVQLDQRKNEAEWHLGEHRQWLSDANRRIGELEKEISAVRAENGNIQQSLNARIQELEEINRNLLETINRRESELSAIRQPLDESAEHRSTATIVLEEKCPGEGAIETTRIEMVGGDLSALSKTIQDLRHELNYQKVIDTLTEQKKDTEKSLTEQTNLLSDAYKKINELEDLLSKSAEERDEALKDAAYKSVKMLQEEVEITRTLQEDEAHVRVERSVQREPTPSREDINQIRKELEELRGEMSAKNAELANLCKLKDEAEWCLGEHRQWLSDANNRNSQMSGELAEKQRAIDALNGEKEHLRREIDSLNEKIKALSTGGGYSDAQPSDETRELEARLREKEDQIHKAIAEVDEKEEEITNLHHVIEDLRNEMNEKNRIIDELNKIKADCEWSLGEHRQWLSDANGKANWLEGELNNMRRDTEAKHAEIEDLRRTIGEKDNQINELQKKIEQAASDASAARSERELTPSEEELRMLQAKLRNAVEKNELLQNELDDARVKIDYMQQQADTTKYRESVAGTGEKSPVSMEAPISSNDLNELSEELIRVSRNKYELQEKMKRIEMEAETSKERVLYLEGETRRMGEQIWLANERVANQDRELGDLHGQVSWLRSENERLGREMEEEKRKFMEAGGVDYSKYEEMRQAEATLREEKSKVEWHLGEVTQWWNDAKWRIGELEAGMAHRQWLLDQANQKVFELSSEHEYLRQFRDKAKNTLDGTFLIRRQPIDGRYKWRLAMWDENSPDDLKDYRRVWFETTAPNAKRVFLSASFVNWECALLCDNFDKENNKFGVWVDIPPGRYEFLFIVDGEWKTCDGYPTVTNEFGSQNNWRYID